MSSDRPLQTNESAELEAMTSSLAREIGSEQAEDLADRLGLEGLEAIDAMLCAVKRQSAPLIQCVYDGILNGRMGAKTSAATANSALITGIYEAIYAKPDSLLTLLKLSAHNPDALLEAREQTIARFSDRSFLAVCLNECVLRQVAGPGRMPKPTDPASLSLQSRALCEAFWSALPVESILSIQEQELRQLRSELAVSSYGLRIAAFSSAVDISETLVDRAQLERSTGPGKPKPRPYL